MKQTAVEWLYFQLIQQINPHGDTGQLWETLQKAKAMEKEQIIDAYDDGKSDGYKTAREWDEMVIFSNAEQYYNETYQKK